MPRRHNQGWLHVRSGPNRLLQNATGPAYSAEATALFARMSVAPDDTRKGHIDTLIAALKTAGVWTKMDALYVMAAHDAQAARLNWKADAFNLVPYSDPTFTADLGYVGDGVADYLDTEFIPNTHGNTSQNDAHIGIWVTAGTADTTNGIIGSVQTYIMPFRGGAMWAKINNAGATATPAVAGALGHSMVSRTGATLQTLYKDGVSLTTNATASAAEENLPYYILSRSTTGTQIFAARTVGAAHFGTGLSGAEVSDLYAALDAYMTAVGA